MDDVRLMPEYGTSPLWFTDRDENLHNPAPAELGLPADLARRVTEWDARFQDTLDEEYPPDSAFPSEAEEAAFVAEGRRLADEVSGHLGVPVEFKY